MYKSLLISVCVLIPWLLAPTSVWAQDKLKLSCSGVLSRTVRDTVSADYRNSYGESAEVSAQASRRVQSAERLLLEVDGSTARVHFPSALIPPIAMGGSGGWWPVYDLQVSDSAISGRARINPLNKPSFTIDRLTGALDLKGWGSSFSGDCENFAGAERKF